jgi:hypothetical protein
MPKKPVTPKATSKADSEQKRLDLGKLKPSEFMRARRPERFADSRIIEEPKLTPAVFEYQLETLTNRKQETEFEHFARGLAERDLCPNLLPQTGPTGGGDSKVDTETYPIAEEIALRWYEGAGSKAHEERWAFALSAKKDWDSKVEQDVSKIVKTGRNYALIYFITNQFVPAKKRAEKEDSLAQKYGIPVRILDRSWIMKSVFDNRHQDVAIESLHLTGYENSRKREIGPNDARREAELRTLDAEIADTSRYKGVPYQLGEDCLRSALLARGLGASRAEIEGRFARAEAVARKLGHPQQRLRIAYNKAWTAFWWFDDFNQLNALYDEVEPLAIGSDQADDLERLANLWTLLKTSIDAGELKEDKIFDERTNRLREALTLVAADETRPNNALLARTKALLMYLQLSLGDQAKLSDILADIGKVLDSADGLISYPVEPITKIIRELGSFLPDNPQYDELLERVVTITEKRASRGEAGRVLLERGFQKLESKRPYDAIVLFGRAQQLLALREFRDELIAALFGAGLAYESVGLLWAARANALAGANQALCDYSEDGTVTRQLVMSIEKLVWLELQLGRVPAVLQWIEAASVIAPHARLSEEGEKRYSEHRFTQDAILGILLLKADLSSLKWLAWLPPLLDQCGLSVSWMALLYALGYEDYMRSEKAIPPEETPEQVRDFFVKLSEQPAASDIPEQPDFYLESRVTLHSSVLGCELIVNCLNNLSISFGERILASLEALLATSLEGATPHVERFTINVRPSEFIQDEPEYEFDDVHQTVTLTHKSVDDTAPAGDGEWLQGLLANIIAHIVTIGNLEAYGERVFGQESGFARAINFSDAIVPLRNIVGKTPKCRISDWENPSLKSDFPLRRSSAWNEGLKKEQPTVLPINALEPGAGPPPSELQDCSQLKHKDRRVSSLINMPLWDRAHWKGTAYAYHPTGKMLPIMALAFEEFEAGKNIFLGWREKLGGVDKEEALRVSIITGIDAEHPHWYRVLIGSNPRVTISPTPSQVVLVSRIHTMNADTSGNLNKFLESFHAVGKFLLAPASIDEKLQPGGLSMNLTIEKSQLTVRPAWEVGLNEHEIVAIQPDDNPVLPKGKSNIPILAVLDFKKKKHGK